MKQFTTQQEVEQFKREQVRKLAQLQPKEEKVTVLEVCMVLVLLAVTTVVLPVVAGWITR